MAVPIINCECPDYTEYYTAIIDNQAQELDKLTEITENQQLELEQLTYQTEMLAEEITGLATVINYQEMFFEMSLVLLVILGAWKMLSKWFFGGV